MRRAVRRAWSPRRGGVRVALAAAVACGAVLLFPASLGTRPPADRLAAGELPTVQSSAQAFAGVPAVGALFTVTSSGLRQHFCTASVVHSTGGNLAVTAAHCLTGVQGQVVFVPGYADGNEPYGAWPVAAVYTDQAWQTSRSPDDDVAFLRLSRSASGTQVEEVTGGERLAIAWPEPARIQVIGYPDGSEQPVSCVNWVTDFRPGQLEFDCDGYTDGASGSPFLAGMTAPSAPGTVIAVIGGYEQGGDTPAVSYAAVFGPAVAALYRSAQAAADRAG
jgi:V8-like Glu-specific endopeptidase